MTFCLSHIARPFIIAEVSGNHMGSMDKAISLIDAAKEAGADAVKFQTYTPDTITLDCDGPAFRVEGGQWGGRRLYDLYQEAHTPFEWHETLFNHSRSLGLIPFSAPFDLSAIVLLESLNVEIYKIASCELVDHQLIKAVARTGKPMFISTGMATIKEIEEALDVARENGASEICLFHCISGYPTPASQANLATIADLSNRFNVMVGLSDHTKDNVIASAAIALGAQVIEKHLCLSRDEGSVDAAFSLEPDEFSEMVSNCHKVHSAIGAVQYGPMDAEAESLRFRRSLYIAEDVAKGDIFNFVNLRSVRPAGGLHVKHLEDIIGKRAGSSYAKGTALTWSMVEQSDIVDDAS